MAGERGRRSFLKICGGTGIATVLAGCSGDERSPEDTKTNHQTSSSRKTPSVEWRTVYKGENKYRVDVKVQFNDAETLIFETKQGVIARLSAPEADGEWRTIASRFDGDSLIKGGATIIATTKNNPELESQSLEKRSTSTSTPLTSSVPWADDETPTPDDSSIYNSSYVSTPIMDYTRTRTPKPTQSPTVVDYHTPTPRPNEKFGYLEGLETNFNFNPNDDRVIEREFTAYSEDSRTTYTRAFSRAVYDYYSNQTRQYVDNYQFKYGSYVSDMLDQRIINSIVSGFEEYGRNNNQSEREVIEHMMSLVQNLEYTRDKPGTGWNDYPKYPVETLVEKDGDCEDTSILMANLLRNYGYGTKLIYATADMTDGDADGHMAVGIKGGKDVQGTYYEDDQGDRYYFIETTEPGVPIGEEPSWMNRAYLQSVGIHPLPGAVYAKVTGVSGDQIGIYADTVNTGPVGTDKLQIRVTLIDSERYIIDQKTSDYKKVSGFSGNIDEIGEDQTASAKLILRASEAEDIKLVAESFVNGSKVSQTESSLRSPQ